MEGVVTGCLAGPVYGVGGITLDDDGGHRGVSLFGTWILYGCGHVWLVEPG
jgi:hypothetical protein